MRLVIGNKNWSTWSLRPWLVIKRSGAAFEEINVALRQDDTAERIAALSPSGKVPALHDAELVIWDSLAISEYLADRFPEAMLWPADPALRGLARSAACEMHSGFPSLRGECPMEISLRSSIDVSPATETDVRRIVALWNDLRGRFAGEGPWLVGQWSIADAFFTPVATRFRSYGIRLSDYGDQGSAGAYAQTLLADAHFKEWEAAALAE
jgi:glutathione S-transferase